MSRRLDLDSDKADFQTFGCQLSSGSLLGLWNIRLSCITARHNFLLPICTDLDLSPSALTESDVASPNLYCATVSPTAFSWSPTLRHRAKTSGFRVIPRLPARGSTWAPIHPSCVPQGGAVRSPICASLLRAADPWLPFDLPGDFLGLGFDRPFPPLDLPTSRLQSSCTRLAQPSLLPTALLCPLALGPECGPRRSARRLRWDADLAKLASTAHSRLRATRR
ncbi:hypothetical protein C8R47DRAFT_1205039 [Mycena vitilis]|nr:hypothetical protein C8R47DRAFT_1205039 [Mycena vitilis]